MDWIEIRDMLGLNITPDQLRKISVGYAEYDDYLNGNSGVATTILSISDLHIPFQKPLETFEKYAGKIDVLQLMVILLTAWRYLVLQKHSVCLQLKK